MARPSNELRVTFNFKYGLSKDGEITLSVEWLQKKRVVQLPNNLWPQTDAEMEDIIRLAFPTYRLHVRGFHRAHRVRAKRLDAYYKRLVPDQEHFTIKSGSGKEYRITVMDKGKGRKFHCNCPDYAFRRKKAGTYCKHILEWLKKKEHPVAEELIVDDRGPSTHPIPSLWRKVKRTMRTFDCDEFLEEEFEQDVAKILARRQAQTTVRRVGVV